MTVTYYPSGLFSPSRCSLEGFDPSNDTNPRNGRTGIRHHRLITALFLAMLGKITLYTSQNGKWIYLNKNSYKAWKKWRASLPQEAAAGNDTLPSPEVIKAALCGEVAMLPERASVELTKKNAALIIQRALARNLQLKLLEHVKLRAALKKKHTDLNAEILKNQDSLENLKRYQEEINEAYEQQTLMIGTLQEETELQLEKLEKKKSGMKVDLQELGWNIKSVFSPTGKADTPSPLSNLQNKIVACQETLSKIKQKLSETQQAYESEALLLKGKFADHTTKLASLIPEKEKEEVALKDAELKIGRIFIIVQKLNAARPKIEESAKVPEASPSKTDLESTHEKVKSIKQQAIEQLEHAASAKLGALLITLWEKFPEKQFKSWSIDDKGNFTLALHEKGKLWIHPHLNNGKTDAQVPKGVVFILGDGQRRITGQISSCGNTVHFQSGFASYCQFDKGFLLKGVADGVIKSFAYDPSKNAVTTIVKGTARAIGISREEKTVRNFAITLNDWKKAAVIDGNHEKLLNA